MFRSQISAVALALCLISAGSHAQAQTGRDSAAVEVAAASAMLAHRDAGNTSIGLDPRLSVPHHHTGSRETRPLRADARSRGLAKALDGSVRTLEEVMPGWGPLRGVSVHLSLGAPTFFGDTATVEVTMHQNLASKRSPVYYESRRVTLVRSAMGWCVIREEQLGSS